MIAMHVDSRGNMVDGLPGEREKHSTIFFFFVMYIDGFQMSIKRPTSGGQARDQKAAVQRTFHLVRILSSNSNVKDSI